MIFSSARNFVASRAAQTNHAGGSVWRTGRPLDVAIEAEMHKILGGGKVMRIEEPMFGGANGALKIAHDMPEEYWEKLK